MMRFKFHIIGRVDGICNIETFNLKSHDTFGGFALQTKVSWSKNVVEERDCPDQLLLGANDTDFCVLLGLACYIESRLSVTSENPRFLFGERDDEDEPDRMNQLYCGALRRAWRDPEFVRIL